MARIHPTAVVDSRADLAADATVGPFVVIEGDVSIGAGTAVGSHSVIHGSTVIGARCRIGPGAYVGMDPQHLGYKGEPTWLIVGDDVVIREQATLHRAFRPGRENATRVGNRCFFMAGSHVAHDCNVGEGAIFANGVAIGGHVEVGAGAFLGGGTLIHQYCQIGRLAILAGNESVSRDVPPFSATRYGGLKGYNAIGCKRSGMSREAIHALRAAFHCLHSIRTTPAAVKAIGERVQRTPEVIELLDFIARSRRGIQPSLRFSAGRRAGDEVD